MKNIRSEKPSDNLHGRLLESANLVSDKELRSKKVLDIGCGYGWCELNFLKRGALKIIATEISENDLKTIKSNIKDKRVVFKVASAPILNFKDKSFDLVVAWEVLEHIPKDSEELFFSEVARVLKKGGFFCISTPYDSIQSKISDPAWWLIRHRHYSKEKIRKISRKSKLKVVDLYAKGKYWDLILTLNMYFSKWLFHKPPFLHEFFHQRIDQEYKNLGFIDLFAKFKKP